MLNTQLIHCPYHDLDTFYGFCLDCGLEYHDLVINKVQICEDCGCKFTFYFDQLTEINREHPIKFTGDWDDKTDTLNNQFNKWKRQNP